MSDETITSLREWFSAKGAIYACPMCRNERWGCFNGLDAVAPAPGLPPAYGLVCLNCGFVRWHVQEVLEVPSPTSKRDDES
jgi:hypothetical protein